MMRLLKTGLLLCLAAPLALAQERSKIAVTFTLAPSHRYNHFNDARTQFIVTNVRKDIVEMLQKAFPIYGFSEQPTPDAHTLDVVLDDDPRTPGPAKGVVFVVRLDEQRSRNLYSLYVDYRSVDDRGEPLPPFDIWAKELSLRFANEVEEKRQSFMSNLFASIIVAHQGYPMPKNLAFLLDFSPGEFAEGSVFLIKTRDSSNTSWDIHASPDGAAPAEESIPVEYRQRLRARAESPENVLEQMGHGSKFVPQEIRLSIYNLGAVAVGNVRPSSFASGGGK
jgi:hypothetical protein